MFQITYIRLMSLLGIVGGALQIVGLVLPCRIISSSYGIIPVGEVKPPLPPTEYTYYLTVPNTLFVLLFPFTIFVPLIIALLTMHGRSWLKACIWSLVATICGFVSYLIANFFLFLHFGFCMSAGSCRLEREIPEIYHVGVGQYFMFVGFILAIAYAIIARAHVANKHKTG